MELWFQVFAWVLTFSYSCYGLAGGGSGVTLKIKDTRKGTTQGFLDTDEDAADHAPDKRKTGESSVEVSAHGQLLGKEAAKAKKPYYFQVYQETANTTILMEEETESFEETLDGAMEELSDRASDCKEHVTKVVNRDFSGLGEASVSNFMGFTPETADTDEDIGWVSCAKSQNEEFRFLTKWRLRTGATGDSASATEIRVDYKCCRYGDPDKRLTECIWMCAPGGPVIMEAEGADPRIDKCQTDGPEGEEGKHPAVKSHGSILVLMEGRLGVECPETNDGSGVRALVGWFMEKSDKTESGNYVRLRYYCCALPEEEEIKFVMEGGIVDVSTDPTYKDDKIGALTAHNVECPGGTVMSGWRMKEKDGSKFHIVAYCQKIDGMPAVGAAASCKWVGDPHYRCFEEECNHDPMAPSTGFYWIVKNDVVQIQGYYQGLDNGQPMRTKGVAFGGRFMMGCKLIVNHRTRKLDSIDAPKVYTSQNDREKQVCYCKGACTDDMCTPDTSIGGGVEKNCGTNTDDEGVEEAVAPVKFWVDGSTTHVLMPMDVKYEASHRDSWMDNLVETPKLPGTWDGQCGNWNGNPADDNGKGANDEWRIGSDCDCGNNCDAGNGCYREKLTDECLFFGEYTGANGVGGGGAGGAMTLEECPEDTLKEANAVCNMLFPPSIDAAENKIRKVYKHMCLLDECNTKGADAKAAIADGDKAASEVDQLNIDDSKPRVYKPTPKPDTDSQVLCKETMGKDAMLAKPTTQMENEVILQFKDEWAEKEVESERVTSTPCLKIGIWKAGPDGDKKWYWMPDYISKETKRCGDAYIARQLALNPTSVYIPDCFHDGDAEYGLEVSSAYDHLWAGSESNNQKVLGLANPNMDSVCVYKDSLGKAKWKAYKHTDRNSHACSQEKRFGIIADSNAVMARSYCGMNKQLALMKSKHEISIALATKLMGLEPTDTPQELYIGGAFIEDQWMWDDGTPIENSPEDWLLGAAPPDHADGAYVCLIIPSCHLKPCSGRSADGTALTRGIICESTHEARPCPLSMYPMDMLKYGTQGESAGPTDDNGALWPLPQRAYKYHGHCYYIGAHQETCDEVCKGAIKKIDPEGAQTLGICDAQGLVAIRSEAACQMVVAGFKLNTETVESSVGRVDQYKQNGCMFQQRSNDKKVYIELSKDDAGAPIEDPSCESSSDPGQHRVCACTLDHGEFNGALGVSQTIEISGMNSPATTLLERREAKIKAAAAKAKTIKKHRPSAREALLERANGGHGNENLEGTLSKKWFQLPTTTTQWVPSDDVTYVEEPPDPLTQPIKIELVDASGLAGAATETVDDQELLENSEKTKQFTSITFEAVPASQTIERCYHKIDDDGVDEGLKCDTSTLWPFDQGLGAVGDSWALDLRETTISYEVFVNGMRLPILDFPRTSSDFPTGVQLSGAYGGHVSRIPQLETTKARYNYLPENGCLMFPHKIEGPAITWHFTFVSDDLGGTQAIHGIPGEFPTNPNIYLFNGLLRIVVADNGPREITFEYPFQARRVYGVAIHYMKAEKVVELYINTKRVEYQYYTNAVDVNFPEGLVGCTEYETSENKFLGKIWEFYVDLKSPVFRPVHDRCVEQHCEGPKWKKIENYDTAFCTGSICIHEIDEAVCCEEMPLCKNTAKPFQCEEGSDWASWADDTYCEDRLCEEGQASLCCAEKGTCDTVDCGTWHVSIPDSAFTRCTATTQCVQEVDFDKCCEPVQNCSTHECKPGFTRKPHALSTPCAGRECGDADDATCCAHKGKCTMLRCPDEMLHKIDAWNISCEDTGCNESSYGDCCMQEGRCDSIECPAPEISISAATTTYCNGLTCDRTPGSKDMQLCCEEPAPCSWYAEEWCGQEYVHKVFKLKELTAKCPGRVCREGEDKLSCCEPKATCENKTCPLTMRYLPNYLDIYCDSITCDTTADFQCCSEDSACSTFDCARLGNYVLKLNHSIEHCDDIVCRDSDLDKCCDEAPLCDTRICPSSMIPHPEAEFRYCQDRECSLNDKGRCCKPKMTCDRYDCDHHDMLKRHDAPYTLCLSDKCDDPLNTDTPPEICCVVKGSCLAVECKGSEGWIHKSNAGSTICTGGDCGDEDQAVAKCCEQKEYCSEWQCPRRYNKRKNADQLPCGDRYCSHADLHRCCQMEGWCINRTCPIGWQHRPDAFDVLCDDMACSEAVTPEEKCCAEKGRCNSYTCPHKYIPKLNASKIDCSDFHCSDDDLSICCDNATECSHHKCGEGMILRGDHADHVCKNRECSGVDHELCCVEKGSCRSLTCPDGTEHIMNEDLLCTDEFCNATDPTVCCESKGKCVTYGCPEGYVHRDPPDQFDCLGPECTDHDRDRCCVATGYCNDQNFECPDGMTPKVNHHNLFCPESECTTNDRLICCTFADRCDSMQCPPRYLHRHDAYEISCKGSSCNRDEDHELCCVEEGNCYSWRCPEEYVHRDNATKIFCEDWLCHEAADLDTCCIPRAPCNELQCKPLSHDTLVNRWDARDHLCVNKTCAFTNPMDEHQCCTEAHMCSTFLCSDGLSHRHNANNISCSDKNCTDTDEDLCCAARDMCHTYMCPRGYVHLDDADTRECQGFICDETDRDTCCRHVQWCNAMICPTGYANKVDAAGRLCKTGNCNEEDDKDHCCDMTHTCDQKICAEGWALRMDAATRPCDDINCLNTDNAYCCEEKPHCFSDLACPKEWVQKEPIPGRTLRCESGHRDAEGNFVCTEADMKEVCCTPIEHCDQYDPPLGYYLKPDGWNRSCVSWKCTDVDLHTCAGEAGYCGNYSCSKGYVHRHDAHHIMCQDSDCEATNEDVCCVPEGHCHSVKCDADYIHRPINDDTPACLGEKCDPGVDHDRCCRTAPKCNDFLCGNGWSIREHAENISCIHFPETQSCNDEDKTTCCAQNGMCSTYDCGDAMLHRHDAHEVMCDAENCGTTNESTCCAMMGFCPTYACPAHMVHKNNSETTQCRDDLCTDADKYYCCDTRATCQNFRCPPGKVWKVTHDLMHTLFCDGPSCENPRDDENCCKMEAGCTAPADCSYPSCVSGENNFASECASGDPVADGLRKGKNGPTAIEGECFQTKRGDFACMNQPCGSRPSGAGPDQWCCNGDLFRSCVAKTVVEGTSSGDVTGEEGARGGRQTGDASVHTEEGTTTTVSSATDEIEAGACYSHTGCSIFENVKMATLLFGGLLALLPLAMHVM